MAPGIAAHEGTTKQTNSHTFFYYRRLYSFDLGSKVEGLVGELGGISDLQVRDLLAAERNAARSSADSADAPGINNFSLPNNCKLKFNY